jgi:D-alanyl-lipoteichoic acid acyltransferase DltB (MBOAT superfamily)
MAFNLGLLGFFKYVNFFVEQVNSGLTFVGIQQISFLEIALPIGISFYTFHSMGYLIDIYRKQISPSESFLDYSIYVAFFPQLVAGPILRAKHFLPQLREKINNFHSIKQIIVTDSNLKFGITLMAIGFLKKMFFADNIAPLVNQVFQNPVGYDSFSIMLATLSLGIQIYGDFSGYSDIAIGAALILGFTIPKNFNKPFFATSPSEFWRRWHISLSTWVRDYLYLPMVFKNRKSLGYVFASLMVTFFLLGLWHGAGWNFMIFGLLHGSYVGIDMILRSKYPSLQNRRFFSTKIGKLTSILFTQYLIFFAFIAFRVENFDHMSYAMMKFIFIDFQTNEFFNLILQNKVPVILVFLFIILHFVSYMKKSLIDSISALKIRYWIVFLIIIIGSIFYLYDANPDDFIYFRF